MGAGETVTFRFGTSANFSHTLGFSHRAWLRSLPILFLLISNAAVNLMSLMW